MSRPVSIHDDAILEAARKVFLAHGFPATTAEVARQAGVSEGSLFKRFPTKSALFMAAMNVETKEHVWQDQLLRSVGTGDMQAAIEAAGSHLIRQMQTILPRIMMMHSSGVTVATDYYLPNRPPAIQHLRLLARYFRAEAKRGRLACESPEIQAHAFIGALQHYVICDFLHHFRPAPPARYIRAVVQTLLRATKPERKAKPIRSRTKTGRHLLKGARK